MRALQVSGAGTPRLTVKFHPDGNDFATDARALMQIVPIGLVCYGSGMVPTSLRCDQA